MRLPHRLVLLLALPLLPIACSRGGGGAAGRQPQAQGPASSAAVSGVGVVAEVDGAPILASELDQRAAARLARVRQDEYDIRRQTLDELIAERLMAAEAARRGISIEELSKREVAGKVASVPEAAVASIYEQNKGRFGATPRDQALSRIREAMDERARGERRAAFEKQLRDKARVAVRLEPPRVAVAIPDGAPVDGPAGAPVSIVEFTDYQCPFCQRAQPTLEQVLAKYRGKVRLVHLDFPLQGMHPQALPAARAAHCAGDQGRFWEYHRDLMNAKGSLDEADLKARARKLGLEPAAFGACLASSRHEPEIRAAYAEGESLGVSGTPAYFVNGRMLTGAQPLEGFSEVIDAELLRR